MVSWEAMVEGILSHSDAVDRKPVTGTRRYYLEVRRMEAWRSRKRLRSNAGCVYYFGETREVLWKFRSFPSSKYKD